MLVRTSAGEQFRSAFHVKLGAGWQVHVQGGASGTEAARRIDIEIEGISIAERLARAGQVTSVAGGGSIELSTSITTAPYRFVVLGVSPIGPIESVFVVQVREE